MTPFSGLVVDGILALLMIAVIAVCLFVSKRLGSIRAGQAELRALVDQLNTAVVNAERGVTGLKSSAEEIEARLSLERQKASVIADELSMMTETGNNLANRIEQGLVGAKASASPIEAEANKASKKQQEEIIAALKEAR